MLCLKIGHPQNQMNHTYIYTYSYQHAINSVCTSITLQSHVLPGILWDFDAWSSWFPPRCGREKSTTAGPWKGTLPNTPCAINEVFVGISLEVDFIQLIHMDSQGILYNNVYLSRTCWGNIASPWRFAQSVVYKPEKTTKNMYVYICVCIYLFIYLFYLFVYLFVVLFIYL